VFFLCLLMVAPFSAPSAQRRETKTGEKKEVRLRDGTVQEHFANAEALLKRGNLKEALELFIAIYNFSRDCLRFIEMRLQDERRAFESIGGRQEEKERAYLRLKRIEDLEERYREMKMRAAYYAGYIQARLGKEDAARRLLIDALSDPKCAGSSFCEECRALLKELLGIRGIL